jgi:hypothetical protein
VAITSLRGNTFGILLEIILFYATVVYLNTRMNNIHTVTSNVNNAWYDMVLHRRAWSTLSPPVWSPSLRRCGAKSTAPLSWSLRLVSHNLPCLTISHHMPPLQNQVRRFYFSFVSFTWFLGLSHKNRFLPTNMKPRCWSMDSFFDSLLRVLCCRCHIHYSWRNKHPTIHFYTVQAIC